MGRGPVSVEGGKVEAEPVEAVSTDSSLVVDTVIDLFDNDGEAGRARGAVGRTWSRAAAMARTDERWAISRGGGGGGGTLRRFDVCNDAWGIEDAGAVISRLRLPTDLRMGTGGGTGLVIGVEEEAEAWDAESFGSGSRGTS